MEKKIVSVLLLVTSLCFPTFIFAETVILKSGKKIEGKIIERTDKYIKIDFNGVPLPYFFDEIDSIDGKEVVLSTPNQKANKPSLGLSQNVNTGEKIKSGASRKLKTIEDVMQWSTFYYQEPDVNNVILALKIVLDNKLILSDLNRASPQIHLFATMLKKDKTKITQVKDIVQQYTGNGKDFLLRVVQEAENFQSPNPKDPNDLDCLWGEFFVTGSAEPIKKIISVLLYTEEDIDLSSLVWKEDGWTSKAQALFTLKHVAEWSLSSNAKQHKKVYDIINQELELTNDQYLKERLRVILEEELPGSPE